MKYEYNGNLLEDDRINLVANEIMQKYNDINQQQAQEAAMLEGKISTLPDNRMKFNRLYNILLVLRNDVMKTKEPYNDLVNLINNHPNDPDINYYYTVAIEIANYLMNKRDFPFLEEFN